MSLPFPRTSGSIGSSKDADSATLMVTTLRLLSII